jgi:hypothetical protein
LSFGDQHAWLVYKKWRNFLRSGQVVERIAARRAWHPTARKASLNWLRRN